jgi:ankyrin repeat protein
LDDGDTRLFSHLIAMILHFILQFLRSTWATQKMTQETSTEDDGTRLHSMIRQGNDDGINAWIASNGSLSQKAKLGNTPLHEAVRQHRLDYVKRLIDAGVSLDDQNHTGNTALHLSAMFRFDDGAQQLLVAGAERNARNLRGETALHLAIIYSSEETTQTLISAGVDANAKDHRLNTPLHFAACFNQVTVAESLLLTGHNPNSLNEDKDTALSLAVKTGACEMIQLLIKHGAVVEAHDLQEARRVGLSDIILQPNNLQLQNDKDGPAMNGNRSYPLSLGHPKDSAKLCKNCNLERWIAGSRRAATHKHWPSFEDLSTSASHGCKLCRVFMEQFQEHCSEYLSASDLQISVLLQLSSDQGSRVDRKDILVVTMGESAKLVFELCIDKGKQHQS